MPNEELKGSHAKLIHTLLEDKQILSLGFTMLEQPQPLPFLNQILPIFEDVLNKIGGSLEIDEIVVSTLNSMINYIIPLPGTKVDFATVKFLILCAKIGSNFASSIRSFYETLPTNTSLLAFLIFTAYFSKNDDSLIEFVKPSISTKFSLTLQSLSSLALLGKVSDIENCPTVKAAITFFKSFDQDLATVMTPFILEFCHKRIGPSVLKDIQPLVAYLVKKLKKDQDNIPMFCSFIDDISRLPESTSLIRQFSDDLLSLYLSKIAAKTELSQEITDPQLYIRPMIGAAFCSVLAKLEMNPFESFFQSKIETSPFDVVLMLLYMTKLASISAFTVQNFEGMLPLLKQHTTTLSPVLQVFVFVCNFFAQESPAAVDILVDALQKGSHTAAQMLTKLKMDLVFGPLAKAFDASTSSDLFIETLTSLLNANVTVPVTERVPLFGDSDTSSLSDSTFNICSGFDGAGPTEDIELHAEPTAETKIFCSVIANLDQRLLTLLPLAASAINHDFSVDLMSRFPDISNKRFQLDSLAAYGNALQFLDQETLYALAQTFLTMLPGRALLFLAITLQRLPPAIITRVMTQTTPYVLQNPDSVAKMFALISYSHPDIAMTFLDNLLSTCVTKRRVFLVFRTSETNEKALIVVFKAVGHCSLFIDLNYFIDEFLTFATKFMNKYLTHSTKNKELFNAQLVAIRKLSQRVELWQREHPEHVFPFKDFLVQFVCTHFLDVGDAILSGGEPDVSEITASLSALSSLLPLRPIRSSEKHERSVEMAAVLVQVSNEQCFPSVFKSTKQFFNVLLKTNNTLNVFLTIAPPMFPALLLCNQWKHISQLLHDICSQWESFQITCSDEISGAINTIGILIAYTLPLAVTDVGQQAAETIFYLASLHCAIRNQILSLPKSIRPTMGNIEGKSGQELAQTVCQFIGKHFMTSQVFDIISVLFDIISGNKVIPEHHLGISVIINYLLKERGNEDFRFDSKLVQGALDAATNSPDNADSYLSIIETLLTIRLNSIISVIAGIENIDDALIPKLVSVIENANGTAALISECANTLFTLPDEGTAKQAIAFAMKVVPAIAGSLNQVDDDTITKLVLGIIIKSPEMNTNLFSALIGQSFTNYDDFAQKLYQIRPSIFAMIASKYPRLPNDYQANLLLSFAKIDCTSQFLETLFISKKAPDYITKLIGIFSSTPSEKWVSLGEQITQLLVQNMSKSESLDCSVAFLNNADDKCRVTFWQEFVNLASTNVEKWSTALTTLCSKAPIDDNALAIILPEITIRYKNAKYGEIVKNLGNALSIEEIDDPKSLAIEVLCRATGDHPKVALQKLVRLMTEDVEPICCQEMIAGLCKTVTEDNIFALNALLDRMQSHPSEDHTETVNALIHALQ